LETRALRPFITRMGVRGVFVLTVDDRRRLIDLQKC